MVLMPWRRISRSNGYWKAVRKIEEEGKISIGVLADKGIRDFENLLVPVGGGINSRLAIHIANDIATQEGSHVEYFRVMPEEIDEESKEDRIAHLQEIVMTQLGYIPANATLSVLYSISIEEAVAKKCSLNDYGLIVIGSSDEYSGYSGFGEVCERVVEISPYSVLAVRRHTSGAMTWLRHQAKYLQRD